MNPKILTFNHKAALRAPDGAFMQLPDNYTEKSIQEQLADRAAQRAPQRPNITADDRGKHLFFPLISTLENLASTPATSQKQAPQLALCVLTNAQDETAADALLDQGQAVLRVHREDDILFIHPIADPADPHAIRAQDVRARRLAASPAPALFKHIWDSDGADDLTELPEPVLHLASALITKACLAWLHDTETQAHHLTRIEMTNLRITSHRVIRVPRTHPLPAQP